MASRMVKGFYTYANGDRYEGDFVDGKQNGKGIYTWGSGDRYEGDVIIGKPNGYGTLYSSNGNIIHRGQWSDGRFVE
jgi:hypothetical protein